MAHLNLKGQIPPNAALQPAISISMRQQSNILDLGFHCYRKFFLLIQIFWFGLIVKLLVKVLVLREELEDIRDIKEEERTGVTRDRVQKPNGIPSSTENKKTQ